jgi:hypothetical protein
VNPSVLRTGDGVEHPFETVERDRADITGEARRRSEPRWIVFAKVGRERACGNRARSSRDQCETKDRWDALHVASV